MSCTFPVCPSSPSQCIIAAFQQSGYFNSLEVFNPNNYKQLQQEAIAIHLDGYPVIHIYIIHTQIISLQAVIRLHQGGHQLICLRLVILAIFLVRFFLICLSYSHKHRRRSKRRSNRPAAIQ